MGGTPGLWALGLAGAGSAVLSKPVWGARRTFGAERPSARAAAAAAGPGGFTKFPLVLPVVELPAEDLTPGVTWWARRGACAPLLPPLYIEKLLAWEPPENGERGGGGGGGCWLLNGLWP